MDPRPRPDTQSSAGEVRTERADVVDAAVRAVPGVADLHPGTFGEVGTYLPGRRVHGVRLLADRCEIHVVLAWGSRAQDTAAAVREAVARAGVTIPVDVTIADIAGPDAQPSPRSRAIPVSPPAAIEAGPDPSATSKETP